MASTLSDTAAGASAPARAIVFIGFMGAGKSTAAADVAAALGTEALDSDRLIEQALGHSIAEEFERSGEASFREREQQVVCRLLAEAPAGLGDRARRRQRAFLAGARGAEGPPDRAARRVRRVGLATGGGGRRRCDAVRWRSIAPLSSPRTPPGRGLYESIADAIRPLAWQTRGAARASGSAGTGGGARWDSSAVGQRRLGRLSGIGRPRPAGDRRCASPGLAAGSERLTAVLRL